MIHNIELLLISIVSSCLIIYVVSQCRVPNSVHTFGVDTMIGHTDLV